MPFFDPMRDNPDLDNVFSDTQTHITPGSKPTRHNELLDEFMAADRQPVANPREAAELAKSPPTAAVELPPKASRPPTVTKPQLLSKRIVEPLRGTRLGYHLLKLRQEFGDDSDIGRTAKGLLHGRIGGEQEDHFAKLGEMLKSEGHHLGKAFNWDRVKESIALDTAVKKFVHSMELSKPELEGQRFSLVAKHYGVPGGTSPTLSWKGLKAAVTDPRKVAFWDALRSHVEDELKRQGVAVKLDPERLDRSIRRLAYQEQDRHEIESGSRSRRPVAVQGVNGKVSVNQPSWKQYLAYTPASVSRSPTANAERYQRKYAATASGNTTSLPAAVGSEPKDRIKMALAAKKAKLQASYRAALQKRTPESLLPKVEQHLAKHGTVRSRDLATHLSLSGEKLREVLTHGVAKGSLHVEQRQSESHRGPDGVYVRLKDDPKKYSAYKAPAGGVTVQGVYYPGGQLVPDIAKITNPTTTEPQPKMDQHAAMPQNKSILLNSKAKNLIAKLRVGLARRQRLLRGASTK